MRIWRQPSSTLHSIFKAQLGSCPRCSRSNPSTIYVNPPISKQSCAVFWAQTLFQSLVRSVSRYACNYSLYGKRFMASLSDLNRRFFFKWQRFTVRNSIYVNCIYQEAPKANNGAKTSGSDPTCIITFSTLAIVGPSPKWRWFPSYRSLIKSHTFSSNPVHLITDSITQILAWPSSTDQMLQKKEWELNEPRCL